MDIYDNSIIVILADHGEEFLDHGGWKHGATLYDEQIRVPLIIKVPHSRKGRIDDRLVRVIDVFQTILKILGKEIPIGLQGIPLIGHDGQPIGSPPHFFAERLPSDRGDQTIRVGDFKLILSRNLNNPGVLKSELYNLKNDSNEKMDLSLTEQALVKKLRLQIDNILRNSNKKSIKSEKVTISKDIL